MKQTKEAIGNLVNRYRAVLKKCRLLNIAGLLAVLTVFVLPSRAFAETIFYGKKETTADKTVENITNTLTSGDYSGAFGGYSVSLAVTPNSQNAANGNSLEIQGGTFTYDSSTGVAAAGGYANRQTNQNSITIKGGTFSGGGIYGGYLGKTFYAEKYPTNAPGSANQNSVSITGGTGTVDVIVGGQGYTTTTSKNNRETTASGNSITISSNITVTGKQYSSMQFPENGSLSSSTPKIAVAGGLANKTSIGNSVTISNGTFDGVVAGGMALSKEEGTVSGNKVSITGGTIQGYVMGGYGHSCSVIDNYVSIGDTAIINGAVYSTVQQSPQGENTGSVTISDTAELSNATVAGVNQLISSSGSPSSYNLTIKGYQGTIKEARRFSSIVMEDSIASLNSISLGGNFQEADMKVKNSELTADIIKNFHTLTLEDSTLHANTVSGYEFDTDMSAIPSYKNLYRQAEVTADNSDIDIENICMFREMNVTDSAQKHTVRIGNFFLDYDNVNVDIQSKNVELGSLTTQQTYGKNATFAINNEKSSSDFTTRITGDLKALLNGKITVGLNTKDSFLTGAANKGGTGEIHVLSANGGRWNMTADSAVTTLSMSNAGTVALNYDNDNANVFRTLTIDELSGSNGVFHVHTDIAADKTDQIVIREGSGSHQINVRPTGTEPNRKAMDSFIVRQGKGNGTFSLANAGGKVEHGLYFYELAERTNDDSVQEWYLTRVGRPDPEGGEDTPLSPTGETEASLSGLAGHYAMWYGQLTDLRKRLGEVRYGTQTGLWVRGFADKSRLDGLAGSSFTQNLYGGSIGYDTLAAVDEEYMWIVGMQLRSAHADQHTNGRWGGHGDLTSMGGGLYSTWVHADGWYVDAAATMDWYNHKIRATMLDGTKVHDDRSSYGLGASLEAGRKMDFGFSNEGRDYWFVEPQLQLSYFWVKGGDFHASNGMKIEQKDMDSLTGRAGLVLGRKFALDDWNGSRYIQPYVKAGVNHEFLGEQEVRINGVRMTSDLDGTRVYYGAGVDWQATDNLRLYMQVEREHGEHFTREYNVSAGLKWKF